MLVTGGAGFVGCNVAASFAAEGRRVRLLDNLSRPGVERNLQWLQQRFGGLVELVQEDLAATRHLPSVLRQVDAVFHFAAQVAVTTSLEDPQLDFSTNLLGTFRLLEALRQLDAAPALVFASTNKVYGNLDSLNLQEDRQRYHCPERPAIGEDQPLLFHTPYGCSKGGAEQYVLDYARSFGVRATVLRMSCIYGPRQCGTEDQGWVAHFLLQALRGEPISVYGNGKQVRDILYVDDLVAAQRAALAHIDQLAGQAWNLGGGVANAVSLLEVLDLIAAVTGTAPDVHFRAARAGDQKFYVSDHAAFSRRTGWAPQVGAAEGLRRLCDWAAQHDLATLGGTAAAAVHQAASR
ncbi:MAG: NAD-dependent epimerase/dehydratase family protein [Pseudomonadales bacterium]